MCLAVPGRIERTDGEGLSRTGRVDFGGVAREVSLSCVPEARVGDWVIVHVGFALSVLEESEARRAFAYLEEAGELAGPEGPR